jgi:hypothetical protein
MPTPAAAPAAAAKVAKPLAVASTCVCAMIEKHLTADVAGQIAAAAVAAFILQCLLYGMIFGSAYIKALVKDKGVKLAENIKPRYSFPVQSLVQLLCNALRAAALIVVVGITGMAPSCDSYTKAAVAVGAIEACNVAHYVWTQRRWQMVILDGFANVLSMAVIATVLTYYKAVNAFIAVNIVAKM